VELSSKFGLVPWESALGMMDKQQCAFMRLDNIVGYTLKFKSTRDEFVLRVFLSARFIFIEKESDRRTQSFEDSISGIKNGSCLHNEESLLASSSL